VCCRLQVAPSGESNGGNRRPAESNGSLLPGLWHDSLHVTCGLTACTPRSAPDPTLGNEYGKTLPLPYTVRRLDDHMNELPILPSVCCQRHHLLQCIPVPSSRRRHPDTAYFARVFDESHRVVTRPGFPGMSRICAVCSRVPARPSPGRQMSRISRHARY